MIRTIPPVSRKRERQLLEKICQQLSFEGGKKTVTELLKDLTKAGFDVSEKWIANEAKHMRTDWT